MDPRKLIELAADVRRRAYTPYSGFPVGAALLGRSGRVYTGCNVENSSYPAGICAERAAVAKAVSEGERDFEAIAIVADSAKPCAPCGICRQVLAEFNPGMLVVMANVRGDARTVRASELLPDAFGATHLMPASDPASDAEGRHGGE